MMMIQYKVISLLFVANVVMGNLGELNSIFSTYTHPRESSTCNSIGEPFQRHTVINNIEKAMEIGLNKSFHEKYICLQKVFDEKLIEMQQAYKQNAETTPSSSPKAASTSSGDKSSKHQSKLKNKYHGHLADHFIGQTGFIFYSIDQNGTITDFKHESFKFVKPVANLSDASLLESELDAFNSDLFALKALSTNIKKNIRLRMNLLKAIETNEKELELEQKEQEKLLGNKSQESEAGSDQPAVSSKKEQKKLKKLQKQKPQAADAEAKKEEKSKEKRNAEEKSGGEEKTAAVNASEQSVSGSSQDSASSSVQDKKPEVDVAQSGEKTKAKRDQAASKNKTKKVKKSKSKSGKQAKSAKRDKSVKQDTKNSISSTTATKPVQKV